MIWTDFQYRDLKWTTVRSLQLSADFWTSCVAGEGHFCCYYLHNCLRLKRVSSSAQMEWCSGLTTGLLVMVNACDFTPTAGVKVKEHQKHSNHFSKMMLQRRPSQIQSHHYK